MKKTKAQRDFIRWLNRASKIVKSWPKWKRDINLGKLCNND